MTTAPTSLEVPTLEQLLLRIEAIKPILTSNTEETEANRRIAQANIDALTEAGAFKRSRSPSRGASGAMR